MKIALLILLGIVAVCCSAVAAYWPPRAPDRSRDEKIRVGAVGLLVIVSYIAGLTYNFTP